MLSALIIFAAEEAEHAEPSKLPFYVAGTVLAVWAFAVSAYGIRRHSDWPSEGAARAVMAVSAVLVAATMFSAVISG